MSVRFINCDDRDDCQYPDCGCPIDFNKAWEDETDPNDKGSMIITHGKDGYVTVMVRSPRSTMESEITLPLADWLTISGSPPPQVDSGREEIARIIDTNAFIQPKHPAADDAFWRGQRKQSALANADAILALRPERKP